MKNKNKIVFIFLAIFIIISIIISIFLILLKNNKNNIINSAKQLNDFDINVISYLDLMPKTGENADKKEAYFSFSLIGIDKETFFNMYNIESIYLNNKLISIDDIVYSDKNEFRFYSSKYKDNNVIYIIIINKDTNERYFKKLEVKTNIVY